MQPRGVLHEFGEGFRSLSAHQTDVVGLDLLGRFRRHGVIVEADVVGGGRSRTSRGKLNRFRVRIPLRQFSATPSKFPTFLHVAARRLGPPCGPYMPRGLRAGFRLDAMIRRASRRWLSSASSAI